MLKVGGVTGQVRNAELELGVPGGGPVAIGVACENRSVDQPL